VTGCGNGFDLSWAIDATGAPVALDEIHYVRVSTASHIYAGAIGEKSTEIAGVRRAAETSTEVGVSAAPESITINGAEVSLEDGVFIYYNVPFGDAGVDVEVTADASANVYINDARGTTRTFATAPVSGTIRVVVQDGDKEPVIIYLNSGDAPVVQLAEPVLPTADQVKAAYDAAVAYENAQPSAANLGYGSEWVVLGLARGGAINADQRDAYLNSLAAAVQEADGVLTSSTYTTYSRVVLALTALGVDATDFAGYDLTAPLADRTKVTNQGRNGVIFALLALNSGNYGDDADKEFYVDYLLSNQVAGGGWSLSGAADPDVTGMALQALAPYYRAALPAPEVVAAVDDALAKLSSIQADNAGFVSWNANASESAGQVLNALSTLGLGLDTPGLVKADTTAAFTVWDAFIGFQLPSGAFQHVASGPANGMATEQAVYNLNALYRSLTGATSLYDMSDVTLAAWPVIVPDPEVSLSGTPNGNGDIEVFVGGTVTFTATGFTAGEQARATVYSDPIELGAKTVAADGTASWTWTVPDGFDLGAHTVVIRSLLGKNTATAPFVVVAKPDTGTPGGGTPGGGTPGNDIDEDNDTTAGGSGSGTSGGALPTTGSPFTDATGSLGLFAVLALLTTGTLTIMRRRTGHASI
jgi:hypothetical protein